MSRLENDMRLGVQNCRTQDRARIATGLFGRTGLLGLASLALVAGAMASPVLAADDDGSNPSFTDRMGEKFKDTFGGAAKAVGIGKPAAPPTPESPSGCPSIAILEGTTAQRVMAPGATGNQGLRYQYSLNTVARECSLSGAQMSVKVGATGRVLLGPTGTSGHFDVPIRVVVYSDFEHKPVQSKLFRVSATVSGGQAQAPFQFVSDYIAVPLANGHPGTDYSIKVGIDNGGKGADVTPKAHRKRKKDVESAATQ